MDKKRYEVMRKDKSIFTTKNWYEVLDSLHDFWHKKTANDWIRIEIKETTL